MRDSFKRLAERSLVATVGLERRHRRLSDRVLILALHNVISRPTDAGLDRSLHLQVDRFRGFLDVLGLTHRFVPLDDVFAPVQSDDPRPSVAVTFDDAYRGALRHALPILAMRNIPSTVFVIPGRLGQAGMWWDGLGASGSKPLLEPDRDTALGEARGIEEEVRALAGARGWLTLPVPEDAGLASLAEFRAALALPGVTIGSHSWSHPNLTWCTAGELDQELRRSFQWLDAEAGTAFRPWIAYPYGCADSRVKQAAETAGYHAGLRVEGGWTPLPPSEPFAVSRLNIPAGLSTAGLRLRGAGLFCR